MTDQPPQPDRRSRPRRQWSIPAPLLVVLGAWLSSLAGIAGSVMTTKPQERAELWGPLGWISQYPVPALLVVTAAAGLVAWWLGRRDQPATASPPGGSLMGTLTLQRPVPLTRAEVTQVRQGLLDLVRRTWIDGVLDRSLAQVARIELGLAEQPDAVTQPWGALLRQSGQPDEHLPPGTRLGQLAERFDHHLLVLGAPGAGKTTLLLEYARDLLDQADLDPATPIPVVFHLSGWPVEQPPIADWLVAELGLRYGVSQRLAQTLVERDRLAVLLDGLDEVPLDRRAECVQVVNAFRGAHGGVPLVVCARSREYADLAAKLALSGAVEVQALDRAQVRRWLAATGRPLAGLRSTLRDREHWLWELLDSPLLLSITALTYQSQPATAIRGDGSITVLLGAYVDTMLARPRAPLAAGQEQVVYDNADTRRWLAWLAERMGPESVFYPDWMQPHWLSPRAQQWLLTTGLSLAAGLVVGLVTVVAAGLALTLATGLAFGLVAGWYALVFSGLLEGSGIQPVEQPRWSWRQARNGLGAGLAGGLAIGLPLGLGGGLAGGPTVGLVTGLVGLLAVGLAIVLAQGFVPRPNLRPAVPLEGIRAAGRAARTVGLVAGLVAGLPIGLAAGLYAELTIGLTVGLAFGLPVGLIAWLAGGGASYLRHGLLSMLLRRAQLIPADLIGFLDYADGRILLRRAGGGYLFVHRLLQDHFAAQAPAEPYGHSASDATGANQAGTPTRAQPP